jgi:hypothetical protein
MHLITYYKTKRRGISESNPSHTHIHPKFYYYHENCEFALFRSLCLARDRSASLHHQFTIVCKILHQTMNFKRVSIAHFLAKIHETGTKMTKISLFN